MEKFLKGKYLIPGATGRMGTHALLRLRNKPDIYIRATYHNSTPVITADNIEWVKVDLLKKEDCISVVQDMDFVFMFAGVLSTAPVMAKDPVSHVTGNMIMNSQILEASYYEKVKKFIWLSSTTGFPMIKGLLKEDDFFRDDPPDKYFSVGWMTRYTESLCRMYATKLKNPIPIIILRPSTIYSEYGDFDLDTCHFLPAIVRKVVERRDPIEIWGDGKVSRDLIYGDDIFDACLMALKYSKQYSVFNIGYGKNYSINEVLKIILEESDGYKANIKYLFTKPSVEVKRVISFLKSQKELGFKAKTTIRAGVKRMIQKCTEKICT